MFSDENRPSYDYTERYPWDSLSQGALLWEFIEHFRANRRQSGKAMFQYRLKTTIDELDAWFLRNVSSSFSEERAITV